MDAFREMRRQVQATVDEALGGTSRCAWVDFPDYTNVGDSAIWLGGLDCLRRRRISISYMADIHNYSHASLRKSGPHDCIVFQGGGNFGDLWQDFQLTRQSIIGQFAEYPIVQFPQSIYFRSIDNLEKASTIIGGHPSFVLIVRDYKSLETAKDSFDCDVRLCPDMAFAMSPKRIDRFSASPSVEVVYLSRSDKESCEKHPSKYPDGMVVADWVGKYKARFHRCYKMINGIESRRELSGRFPLYWLLSRVAEVVAMDRLGMGCRLLCQAEKVVTDRLHGMIISSLLGLKVFAFDNSYGKLSAYYETWRKWLPSVVFCRNEGEAIDAAFS